MVNVRPRDTLNGCELSMGPRFRKDDGLTAQAAGLRCVHPPLFFRLLSPLFSPVLYHCRPSKFLKFCAKITGLLAPANPALQWWRTLSKVKAATTNKCQKI
jgi:hypothetical protein